MRRSISSHEVKGRSLVSRVIKIDSLLARFPLTNQLSERPHETDRPGGDLCNARGLHHRHSRAARMGTAKFGREVFNLSGRICHQMAFSLRDRGRRTYCVTGRDRARRPGEFLRNLPNLASFAR